MGVLFCSSIRPDQRDQINMQVLGDQPIMTRRETGIADAAALDGVFSKRLRQKVSQFSANGQPAQRTVGQAMVVPKPFSANAPIPWKTISSGDRSVSVAPKNKSTVIKTIMKRRKANANDAEEGYQDLVKGVDRKPFPSLDGLRNVQRMLKTRNPKIGEVKTEEVIDARIMRKLDESGFIDRAYAAQGVSLK